MSPGTSSGRVAAERIPNFHESGQDVTDIKDPAQSYLTFIGRVIREYELLVTVFNITSVDAEQSIGDQQQQIRRLFREGDRKPLGCRDYITAWQ